MDANTNGQIHKSILVLGSTPHTHLITAYTWDNLPQYINIADYDVVILNFVPLLDKDFAKSIDVNTLPRINQFIELLFSNESEIIAIGMPGSSFGNNPYQYVGFWLPIRLKFVNESGEQIRNIDPEFDYYFQQVRTWFFYVNGRYKDFQYPSDYLSIVDAKANNLKFDIEPIATTRFEKPIAFKLKFSAVYVDQTMYSLPEQKVHIIKDSGSVIWLPPPTETSDYDAVNLILNKRYGLRLEEASPSWIEVYKLPHQIPIEAEILHCEHEMQRLESELTIAIQKLQTATQFHKLLYEQGVDGLEPVVRDALRELGATVYDPPPKENREDGRLIDPKGRKGILEIKGRNKSLKLDDVRQLDQWVRDALFADSSENNKGILIANMYCGQAIEQRHKPFPPNCIEMANIAGHCLITTTQIFSAICYHQQGKLDRNNFWDMIFNTNGICLLPELKSIDSEQSQLA